MKISPARAAAFDILIRIEKEAAYSSVLLAAQEPHLSGLDRSLCHELTLGTLRRQIELDRRIDALSKARKLDPEVRVALRLALYQIIFLTRVPAHSAVNESVNLVTRARKSSAKTFVNGVLRNALRAMPELRYANEIERVSVETSHPRWLVEKWTKDFGLEQAEQMAISNNLVPAVAFRVVRPEPRVMDLVARARRSDHVDGCYFLPRADEDTLRLAQDGSIYLQDEASQLVAHAVSVPEGGKFIDLCAAPGGKTTLVAGAIGSRCSLIAAGDLYGSRAELLRRTCALHVPGRASVLRYNAAGRLPFGDETFDSVLLDAPCSGTGTIRHNPEIRYRIRPEDFQKLPAEQLKMMKNASKILKTGGTLHYSTCSLELEENEDVCRRFLGAAPQMRRIDPSVPTRFLTSDGFARTFPGRDNMDGFFIAAFEKKPASAAV